MSRRSPLLGIVMTTVVAGLIGCHPQQPFYLFEDGDLSHYLDVDTEIEYPDAENESLADVTEAARPFSPQNAEPREIWDLTLEDAVHQALANSKVLRSIGGLIRARAEATEVRSALLGNPAGAQTVYDPALAETNPRFGIAAAMSAFDAQFTTSMFWEKIDTPRNVTFDFIGTQRDLGNFQAQITKTAATGGTWSLTHNVAYEQSNSAIRRFPSDWNVNLEAEFRQPLLQGNGVQYNRIAGPGAIPGFNNGVIIARINTDVELTRFEGGVRDMVADVEKAYWELYFAYRNLRAVVAGRDASLQTWREIRSGQRVGKNDSHEEARARQQYLQFRARMEQSLLELYEKESDLRFMLGLAATDGRLIRPITEPKLARWDVDWTQAHFEALARFPELRRQRWNLKKAELELISAKNYLLPRVDAVGRYRWLGLGDDLVDHSNITGDPFDNAYESLTGGDHQEWQLGIDVEIPIGFRKAKAGVRNAQLKLARERAILQEQELELSHQLSTAIRDLEARYVIAQTNYNRRVAAQLEVDTAEARKKEGYGGFTLEAVLDAQRRLAEAESEYYRSLVDHTKAIAFVHFAKGSLLEYNGVHLTEGPWPGKAYFDALRLARARDAGLYLDYGYTRPKVISRGPVEQDVRGWPLPADGAIIEYSEDGGAEVIDTPIPEPAAEPIEPPAPRPNADTQTGNATGGAGKSYDLGATNLDGLAAEPAGRAAAGKSYDLGLTGLDKLATKPEGEHAGGWRPGVRRASHQEPVTRRPADRPQNKQWQPSRNESSSSTNTGTRHESVANPSTAGTAWTASGGKGIQR